MECSCIASKVLWFHLFSINVHIATFYCPHICVSSSIFKNAKCTTGHHWYILKFAYAYLSNGITAPPISLVTSRVTENKSSEGFPRFCVLGVAIHLKSKQFLSCHVTAFWSSSCRNQRHAIAIWSDSRIVWAWSMPSQIYIYTVKIYLFKYTPEVYKVVVVVVVVVVCGMGFQDW